MVVSSLLLQHTTNSSGGGVAGKDKCTRAQANDDEGALGGNSVMDKCALGGQLKDNSGGGSGGARGGGAR